MHRNHIHINYSVLNTERATKKCCHHRVVRTVFSSDYCSFLLSNAATAKFFNKIISKKNSFHKYLLFRSFISFDFCFCNLYQLFFNCFSKNWTLIKIDFNYVCFDNIWLHHLISILNWLNISTSLLNSTDKSYYIKPFLFSIQLIITKWRRTFWFWFLLYLQQPLTLVSIIPNLCFSIENNF